MSYKELSRKKLNSNFLNPSFNTALGSHKMIKHHELALVHNTMNPTTLFTYPALGQGCKKGEHPNHVFFSFWEDFRDH